MSVSVGQYTGDAFAVEVLSPDNATAAGTDPAVHSPVGKSRPKSVFMTTEVADCRLTFDGVAPTSSSGHLVPAGSSLTIVGQNNVRDLKIISTTGTNVVVTATYMR